MNIVLAQRWNRADCPEFPLGLAYLAGYIKKKTDRHKISIVSQYWKIQKTIRDHNPSVLGFYSYTSQIKTIVDIVKKIKTTSRICCVLGGPHISSVPGELPEVFDVGVIGEGEESFYSIIESLDKNGALVDTNLEGINGIVYRNRQNTLRITKPGKSIVDIDVIPFPARELFDRKLLTKPANALYRYNNHSAIDIFTVRGCPYKCTFCQQATFGHTLRMHSADYVVKEIADVYSKYQPQVISFSDDLFAISKPRIRRMIDLLKKEGLLQKLQFRADVRANLVDDELIALFKELKVKSVSIGVESASSRLMKKLKGGNVSIENTWKAIDKLNRADINVYACFMVGAPDETIDEIEKTVSFVKKFLKNHPYNTINVNPVTPLPNSELWKECRKNGLLSHNIPWEEYSFELSSFKNRGYNICKNASKEMIYKTIRQLYKIRRNYMYITLLKRHPVLFIREIFSAVLRRMRIV